MKWQDGEHLGGPRWRKVEVGALLAVSARGLALGKRLVEGAFHLPRVRSYSSALDPGFVHRLCTRARRFFCCLVCSFSLVVIRLP